MDKANGVCSIVLGVHEVVRRRGGGVMTFREFYTRRPRGEGEVGCVREGGIPLAEPCPLIG